MKEGNESYLREQTVGRVRSTRVVEDLVLVVVVDDSLATLTEDLCRLSQERGDIRCKDGIDVFAQCEP